MAEAKIYTFSQSRCYGDNQLSIIKSISPYYFRN